MFLNAGSRIQRGFQRFQRLLVGRGGLTIKMNASITSPVMPQAGAGFHSIGIDGLGNTSFFDAFGAGSNIIMRSANGTAMLPGQLAADSNLGGLSGRGHDDAAYTGNQAVFQILTGELWTTTAHGTYFKWISTANGTVTAPEVMRLRQGLSVGNTVDLGLGHVNAIAPINCAPVLTVNIPANY